MKNIELDLVYLTKLNSVINLLLILTFSIFISSRPNCQTTISVSGTNKFRGYSSLGVSDHYYYIYYYQQNLTSSFNDFSICNNGSYGGDMEVNTSTDISIIVTPSSENDFADYASGLSVADGVELGEYLDNQTNSITGNPYKIVAADVNFSNSITVDDKDMIYDLIIGRIQNFDRNSWEWFNEADITNNSTSFNSNPYSFTLSANTTPHQEEFYYFTAGALANSSTQAIVFNYKTTKVGDLIYTSTNNQWVCGTYSFKGTISNRTSTILNLENSTQKVKKGDVVKLRLSLENSSKIHSLQIPLKINPKLAKIISSKLHKRIQNNSKSKISDNELIVLFPYEKIDDGFFENSECLVEFEIQILNDCNLDYTELISQNDRFNIEILDFNKNNINLKFGTDIHKCNEVIYLNSLNSISWMQQEDENVEINLYSMNGSLIFNTKYQALKGANYFELPFFPKDLIIVYVKGQEFNLRNYAIGFN
ncbi:MAG: hypothetical protein IPJ83_07470 [Saprospiraceae bacterium]|nr:hypothetical protein [Candidatus Vicinibacter proximus]